MKQRCNNPNSEYYKNYGDRGIKVCKEWNDNFKKFQEWSLKNGYQIGLQIDRRDNDQEYSPKNCRWVTRQQNLQNRGSNLNGSSKYKGVYWSKKLQKWRCSIHKNNKTYHLGCFNNEGDAALAYNLKAIEFFGEFANMNKVGE